jgi:hypothetical protein
VLQVNLMPGINGTDLLINKYHPCAGGVFQLPGTPNSSLEIGK